MTTSNPITGDLIKTKSGNQTAYSDGWERIFGKKQKEEDIRAKSTAMGSNQNASGETPIKGDGFQQS